MDTESEVVFTSDYSKLLDKYYETDGVKVINNLLPIKTYHFIMARNYKELIKKLDYHNSVEGMLHLWEWKNRPVLKEFMNEIIRLLHNYLSSAAGMIDITRNVLNKFYEHTSLNSEIKEHIEQNIANDKLLEFVKQLRNYIVHYKIPAPTAELDMNNISSNDIYLDKSSLLKWGKWSAKSKSYLSDAPDKISIHALITEYHKSVSAFHEYLNKKISHYHETEFQEMHALERKLEELNIKREGDNKE